MSDYYSFPWTQVSAMLAGTDNFDMSEENAAEGHEIYHSFVCTKWGAILQTAGLEGQLDRFDATRRLLSKNALTYLADHSRIRHGLFTQIAPASPTAAPREEDVIEPLMCLFGILARTCGIQRLPDVVEYWAISSNAAFLRAQGFLKKSQSESKSYSKGVESRVICKFDCRLIPGATSFDTKQPMPLSRSSACAAPGVDPFLPTPQSDLGTSEEQPLEEISQTSAGTPTSPLLYMKQLPKAFLHVPPPPTESAFLPCPAPLRPEGSVSTPRSPIGNVQASSRRSAPGGLSSTSNAAPNTDNSFEVLMQGLLRAIGQASVPAPIIIVPFLHTNFDSRYARLDVQQEPSQDHPNHRQSFEPMAMHDGSELISSGSYTQGCSTVVPTLPNAIYDQGLTNIHEGATYHSFSHSNTSAQTTFPAQSADFYKSTVSTAPNSFVDRHNLAGSEMLVSTPPAALWTAGAYNIAPLQSVPERPTTQYLTSDNAANAYAPQVQSVSEPAAIHSLIPAMAGYYPQHATTSNSAWAGHQGADYGTGAPSAGIMHRTIEPVYPWIAHSTEDRYGTDEADM